MVWPLHVFLRQRCAMLLYARPPVCNPGGPNPLYPTLVQQCAHVDTGSTTSMAPSWLHDNNHRKWSCLWWYFGSFYHLKGACPLKGTCALSQSGSAVNQMGAKPQKVCISWLSFPAVTRQTRRSFTVQWTRTCFCCAFCTYHTFLTLFLQSSSAYICSWLEVGFLMAPFWPFLASFCPLASSYVVWSLSSHLSSLLSCLCT